MNEAEDSEQEGGGEEKKEQAREKLIEWNIKSQNETGEMGFGGMCESWNQRCWKPQSEVFLKRITEKLRELLEWDLEGRKMKREEKRVRCEAGECVYMEINGGKSEVRTTKANRWDTLEEQTKQANYHLIPSACVQKQDKCIAWVIKGKLH